MIRTQVQFTEAQMARLRKISASSGRSVADLVRSGVDQLLSSDQTAGQLEERAARALRFAGKYSSGRTDVSAEHDRHLAEAYRR